MVADNRCPPNGHGRWTPSHEIFAFGSHLANAWPLSPNSPLSRPH